MQSVTEKGHGCVFLPRGERFAFPAFPERAQSADTGGEREEKEGGGGTAVHTDGNEKPQVVCLSRPLKRRQPISCQKAAKHRGIESSSKLQAAAGVGLHFSFQQI